MRSRANCDSLDVPAGDQASLWAYQPFSTGTRSIHLMEKRRFVSHADAEQVLLRSGYSHEQVDDVLRQLPDPIDTERDAIALLKLGVSFSTLMDRMGSSP